MALLELVVVGLTLTTAAWLKGAEARRRVAATEALDAYARSRGLRFVPAPETPRGASPRVVGESGGVPYEIDLYRLGAQVRTRVRASAARGRAPRLSIAKRGDFPWSGPSEACLGDARVDAAYSVNVTAPSDLDDLSEVCPPLRSLAARQGVWLVSDGRQVTLSFQGADGDPRALDAARTAVVVVASRRCSEAPYR